MRNLIPKSASVATENERPPPRSSFAMIGVAAFVVRKARICLAELEHKHPSGPSPNGKVSRKSTLKLTFTYVQSRKEAPLRFVSLRSSWCSGLESSTSMILNLLNRPSHRIATFQN